MAEQKPRAEQPAREQTPTKGVSPHEGGHGPHGIPDGATEHEPKGTPTSDRHETEIAAQKP